MLFGRGQGGEDLLDRIGPSGVGDVVQRAAEWLSVVFGFRAAFGEAPQPVCVDVAVACGDRFAEQCEVVGSLVEGRGAA